MGDIHRDIIECMQSGVAAFRAVRDPDTGDIVDFEWILSNHYGEKSSGYSEKELLGKRVLDVLPDHRTNGIFDRMCQVVETGEVDEILLENPENLSPDGVMDVRMTKVGDGLAIAFTMVTELFEQRRAYEALANRLSIATQSADIGVWEFDVEAQRRDWDERTRYLFGLPLEGELTEDMGRAALHPDDRDRVGSLMQETIAAVPDSASGNFGTRFRVVWPDGSVHHLQSHAQLVQGARGRRVIGVIWDVTDEVEATLELDVKRREAEAANIAKSQFLATMSHEIRTPLNGVLGMANVLELTNLDDAQREMVEQILRSGGELLEILNGILDLSRIESGRLEVEEATFDPNKVLDAGEALYTPLAHEKGLTLRLEKTENVRGVFISDPARIRQVFYNLLSNAVKFTSEGEIVVSADIVPAPGVGGQSDLVLSVQDTGIGIPASKLDAIFEPFSQADGSITRIYGGTGLGLNIASRLANLLGGSVTVTSAEGVGSTFVARFRLKPSTLEAAA